jgi:hypothetical protein
MLPLSSLRTIEIYSVAFIYLWLIPAEASDI